MRLEINGAYAVVGEPFADARGVFAKPFSAEEFTAEGIEFPLAEIFWSSSLAGTIRGMHFQAPPFAMKKLVWCVQGRVDDVILDLRSGSGFGRCQAIALGDGGYLGVLLPVGCAHGFAARTDAVVVYATTSSYSPSHDLGVRWDTINHTWNVENPILSERDRAFPALSDFVTPF